jgi:hypothetical protein
MKKLAFVFIILVSFVACEKGEEFDNIKGLERLSVDDIIQAYHTADSLNGLKDKTWFVYDTDTLGYDARNNKIVGMICGMRSFGCLLFSHYYTVLYLNCDSLSCEKNGGFNITDYVGFAGTPHYVGCAPDTLR